MAVHADRGGTFTDLVRVVRVEGSDEPELRIEKVPSDRAVLGRLSAGSPLTLGTTVATNALLERDVAPTLLLVTAGFEDLPTLRDMRRPDLFELEARWPATLASAVVGLEIVEGRATLPDLDLSPFRSVVVALIQTVDDLGEERRIADLVREREPRLYVVVAREVVADPGYLPRIETALVDAAITPRLVAALVKDEVDDEALAVRSDGTLGPAYRLKAHDAVLSGPAPGVLAVLATAKEAGLEHAIGLDMGGTSTDVCLVSVHEGPRLREGELEVAGVRLSRRMLEVETIAAGGGSVLGCSPEGLSVGPRSAGADPGPQCYGRGGPPTLTDAALVAGLVSVDRFPLPLDPTQVVLPSPDGVAMEPAVLAERYLGIARENMARAIERLAMARGLELSRPGTGLVAYGGAGAQHAAFVAERLGVDRVLVHPAASVFCALGQLFAERGESARRPLALIISDFEHLDGRGNRLEEMLASAAAELAIELAVELNGELLGRVGPEGREVSPTFELECAYAGSEARVLVVYRPGEPPSVLRPRFEAGFAARFGFVRSLPIACHALVARVGWRKLERLPRMSTVSLGLDEGAEALGPTCLFGEHTAIAVPTGWRARSRGGLVELERLVSKATRRVEHEPSGDPTLSRAYETALWGSRLMALAEEGGAVLQRLARSVSIKERLDFSCAVFSPRGELIVNAPHIPVHLGAMGDTVRDVLVNLDRSSLSDGDAWLTNDPRAGGSHLPDLTVITAVLHEGVPFFVASRAHHVDVGGLAPGSMPSRSLTLADEGFCLRRAPLVVHGRVTDLARLVRESRQADVVVADLESQLAANQHMARRLTSLGPARELIDKMALLTASAERLSRRFIAQAFAADEVREASDMLDGVPLSLALRREDDARGPRLVVDLTGTGGPHAGNLNAPPSVVRAAVLYGLRVVLGEDASTGFEGLPLNDGLMTPITLVLPEPSIVSPPTGAAVVGGNVETSQRIVDLFLSALGRRAASQGTMNNLVIAGHDEDGRHWSFYETLGGGLGASPTHAGADARQVHMTNTRATDPEVLSRRLPIAVRRFARRMGSGGAGRHRGGDGLVRELEVLAPATASLIAAWRPDGAPGLMGGAAGLPGAAFVSRAGGPFMAWDGEPIALRPGDRVSVHTPGGGAFGSLENPSSR